MATRIAEARAGTEALEAAQRGFAAFGSAQELAVKAWMRAATRQAELARETMSDCMAAASAMQTPADPLDGQEQMRRAGLAAETWLRTWRAIADDFGHDLMAATQVMMSAAPLPPAAANGVRKPGSTH